jgi:hypothetical protein
MRLHLVRRDGQGIAIGNPKICSVANAGQTCTSPSSFSPSKKAATLVAALICLTLRKSAASVYRHHRGLHVRPGLRVHHQAVAVHHRPDDHRVHDLAHDPRDLMEDDPTGLDLLC